MRFLAITECEAWCADHRLARDPAVGVAEAAAPHRARIEFAPHGPAGLEPAAASAILGSLGAWDECLLWVREWGVWPASEDWPAYYALRGRHQERRSIEAAPGHLFRSADRADLASFLLHVLLNGWDAVLLPAASGRALPLRVHVSHDGWAELHAGQPVQLVLEPASS
ncbi:MAG TPA: hypothetical protein VFQ45_17590 [Longimicrobium sp.]|nr:hypothetical protein [Longimicrobium sp.]